MKKSGVGLNRREFLKKAGVGSIALATLPALGHTLVSPASANGKADHVRWDILGIAVYGLTGRFLVATLTLASWSAVGAWAGALIACYGLLNDSCPDLDIGRSCRGW